MYSVIITAAGSGTRMDLGYNKIFYMIDGRTIVERSVERFLEDKRCAQIVVTAAAVDIDRVQALFKQELKVHVCLGGDTRQASVCSGLAHVSETVVMVHDGARPFVKQRMLDDCYEIANAGEAGVVSVLIKDTIKQTNPNDRWLVDKTLNRDELIAVQTPQSAPTEALRLAHEKAKADGFIATDDVNLIEKYTDIPVKAIKGSYTNLKLTTKEDIDMFEYFLSKRERRRDKVVRKVF